MAAPKIRLRRSATAGNVPTTSQLQLGEVAINTNDGKVFLKRDQSGTERIVDVTAFQETGEPNGHQERLDSTISFTTATRVFSIAPVTTRFDVWCKGIRFAFTSAQTTTIPNTTGLYYIYFDENGVLQNKNSSTDIVWEDETPVAILFWNAITSDAPFVLDTKHGITLDWATHEYLHKTRGSAIYEGFNIVYDFEGQDGSQDRHAQIGLAGGTYFNEDLEVIVVADSTPTNDFEQDLGDFNNPGSIPVLYRVGQDTNPSPTVDGPWVRDAATVYPFKNVASGRMVYNTVSGGVWTTAEITNNYFGVMYIVASSDPEEPIVSFMGQDEYETTADAKAASFANYNFGNFPGPDQTPTSDFRLLYKLIYQVSDSYTNARKARLIEYEDNRLTNFINLVGGREAVITDHGILSGLGDDDHSQYVHRTIDRTITADHTIDTTGSIRYNGSILDSSGSPGIDNYAIVSKNVNGTQTVLWDWARTRPEDNIIYVTKDGNDSNDGLTVGQAKLTIKAAAEGAAEGTVVRVFAGNYTENNPIVLPKQVSIVGSSLREVSVTPSNVDDLFYVTNGNYISDMSFTSPTANTGAIVAFNSSDPPYIDQSPYIQNCTNFIEDSTGLRIDGNDCIGDIKSMVVDSFTQFNPNGFGAKISNEAYAQLVSMFTICCDTAILCEDGGGCDLTNSNSSFGFNGIIADGVSPLKYNGLVSQAADAADTTVRIDISTPTQNVSAATYANTTGILTVTTSAAHGFSVGQDVRLENLTFSCNSGDHTFVSANSNAITDTTGGGSTVIGPVTGADYTSSTGVLELTITSHGLTTGDTILIADESLTFTCESDNNQTEVAYPRSTDPASESNLSVTVIDANTFSVNVGSFSVNQAFPSGNFGYVFKVESTPSTTQFTVNVGTNNLTHTYVSGGVAKIEIIRPYAGQVVYFDTLYYEVVRINITNGGSGYDAANPPVVTVASSPETWGIDASGIALVSNTGVVTGVDVVSSGRGYGSTPPLVTIAAPSAGTTATATAELTPSYFIVESTLEVGSGNDEYDVTFSNELPIPLAINDTAFFFKQSRLLASSHSFQYIGSGVDITTALPQTGGVPTPETETISKNGGLVVYTSTNETGNFNIGDGVQINQALGRISGTAYSQSLFATVTPFILALGG